MQKELDLMAEAAKDQIKKASNTQVLEDLRVGYLGKKGKLTELLKQMGQLDAKQKPIIGQALNQLKITIQQSVKLRREALEHDQQIEKLKLETVDITLPARKKDIGTLHPVTQVRLRVEKLFLANGFELAQGPEIETEYYNFEALNIPKDHPARAVQDTFYLTDNHLLRTHMSTVQIHTLENRSLPLRIIAPGRVFRRDSDKTHTPMFHQVEGLVVDKNLSFSELKGLLRAFITQFFNQELALRFRPSYFPFTRPSAEVDMACHTCSAKGCSLCGQSGWLEILGCGMVHPEVFHRLGINPNKYNGYAFGIGLDRLAMLRYQISDLRWLFDNDLRFLSQF